MIEQIAAEESMSQTHPGSVYLCLHGHFYQPPREDPFTHILPIESDAAPFKNFNEKITAECYRPNAEAGNFAAISFDLGPTLAAWLEQTHPDVYRLILDSDRQHYQRYGVGNAMAQAYNHTILPLANARDKRTQILWGLQDFAHRFGHPAHGMWLAETAIDLESLDIMADQGITYTILAPWQVATPIDPTEPYLVQLPSGRTMTVFFYNAPLSGGVSFDGNLTSNADVFASTHLPAQVVQEKQRAGEAQMLLIATDGELYGHHKPWRDKFLSYLIRHGAPEHGFEICTPERFMLMHPAQKEVQLKVPSAWSCGHGVARWSTGCSCTEGDSRWKEPLREALNRLEERADRVFEQRAGAALHDPWGARDAYLSLRNGWISEEHFWKQYGRQQPSAEDMHHTRLLLEAQYYIQCSFTSCGFFFEDLDRIEPRNCIAFARRAISLIWEATGIDLQQEFVSDLRQTKSWRSGVTGAYLYRQLPVVSAWKLPALQ
ncbi:DUF3536 domain-containing protein [Thermosporothrix hazakensis]|jgi:alpha-amylase/alpha-mannosidase (GH57 family)|nr:DUF3536 domain-containing protein [Thermosporothrix hazakensis]GCE48216.1 hypothetical protein KTH_30850 [Thermosporothrix hazakensis]